jgi:hypothetical protein
VSKLLKIIADYFQFISLSTAFDVTFPDSLSNIFSFINKIGASSSTFLSFDCFVDDYDIKESFPPNSFIKVFLSSLLPVILITVVFIILVGLYFIRREWAKDFKRSIDISDISILLILHPKLTEGSLSIFK